MSQSFRRTQSSHVPNIHLIASQPSRVTSNPPGIMQTASKNSLPPIKFQKLNVTDDFTNEFINENDNSITSFKPIKPNKDSANFDDICEIDQIAILPFIPIEFTH